MFAQARILPLSIQFEQASISSGLQPEPMIQVLCSVLTLEMAAYIWLADGSHAFYLIRSSSKIHFHIDAVYWITQCDLQFLRNSSHLISTHMSDHALIFVPDIRILSICLSGFMRIHGNTQVASVYVNEGAPHHNWLIYVNYIVCKFQNVLDNFHGSNFSK